MATQKRFFVRYWIVAGAFTALSILFVRKHIERGTDGTGDILIGYFASMLSVAGSGSMIFDFELRWVERAAYTDAVTKRAADSEDMV